MKVNSNRYNIKKSYISLNYFLSRHFGVKLLCTTELRLSFLHTAVEVEKLAAVIFGSVLLFINYTA